MISFFNEVRIKLEVVYVFVTRRVIRTFVLKTGVFLIQLIFCWNVHFKGIWLVNYISHQQIKWDFPTSNLPNDVTHLSVKLWKLQFIYKGWMKLNFTKRYKLEDDKTSIGALFKKYNFHQISFQNLSTDCGNGVWIVEV